MAIQVFASQTGRAVLHVQDADGRDTDEWDVEGGVAWAPSHPELTQVIDQDEDPLDAEVSFLAFQPGTMQTIEVTLDLKAGPDVNHATFVSEEFEVLQDPPGEAVGGVVELQFFPVEPAA